MNPSLPNPQGKLTNCTNWTFENNNCSQCIMVHGGKKTCTCMHARTHAGTDWQTHVRTHTKWGQRTLLKSRPVGHFISATLNQWIMKSQSTNQHISSTTCFNLCTVCTKTCSEWQRLSTANLGESDPVSEGDPVQHALLTQQAKWTKRISSWRYGNVCISPPGSNSSHTLAQQSSEFKNKSRIQTK